MPFLNRLRFVNVGHESARFEDMVFDLRGADGKPTDSTLWLRNGGGKSSILNLFFAILRPDSRQFLGSRADSGVRKLEHYIYQKDRSVTVCEWALDAGLSGDARRLLTGVFYERKESSGQEDGDLKRFFFGCFVDPAVPASSLEGLPIYVEKDGKRISRRSLSGFKQEWSALRTQQPHLEAVAFENHGDWKDWLEQADLDPELFNYQLRMNEREGNADELFRFKETEKFIDFLLGLVLDRRFSEKLRETIVTYCEELHRRKNVQVPEHELLSGLRERIAPFTELAARKAEILNKTGQCGHDLIALQKWTAATAGTLDKDAEALDESSQRLMQEGASFALAGVKFQQESAGYRRLAVRLRREEFVHDRDRADRLMKKHDAEAKLWEAAVLLRHRQRAERQVEAHVIQLEKLKAEHAPLLQELKSLAKRYIGALKHNVKRLRAEEDGYRKTKEGAEKEARQATIEGATCQAETSAAKAKADAVRAQLKEAERLRKDLEKRRIIWPGEETAAATQRIKDAAQELDKTIAALNERQRGLSDERTTLQMKLEEARTEHGRAQERETQARQKYAQAQTIKRELEAKPLLAQTLEVDAVDLDRLEDRAIAGLRTTISKLNDESVEVKIREAHDERSVRYLEESGLLPPTPDAQRVIAAIKREIPGVWSGWEYIESNLPNKERRAAVERHPELAAGVIVQDGSFDDAVRIVKKAQPPLESPVVIAGAGAFKSAQAPGAVVGPASDGYFDRNAASAEGKVRRGRLDELRVELNRLAARRHDIQETVDAVAAFRRAYPKDWFSQQAAELNTLAQAVESAAETLRTLGEQTTSTDAAIRDCHAKRDAAAGNSHQLRLDLQRLEAFIQSHGSMLSKWGAEAAELDRTASDMEQKRRALAQKAEEAQRIAASNSEKASEARHEAALLDEQIKDVRYFDGEEVKAAAGDVRTLATEYKLLASRYEQRIGADTLLSLIDKHKDDVKEWGGKLRTQLKNDLTEEKVRRALESLENQDDAERLQKEAVSAYASNMGHMGRSSQLLQDLEPTLTQLNDQCRALEVPDDWMPKPMPKDATALETLGQERDRQAAAQREQSQSRTQQASDAHAKAAEHRQRAQALRNVTEDLQATSADFADIIGSASGDAAKDVEITEAEVHDRKGKIQKELRTIRAELKHLADEREKAARKLRLWADDARFDKAPRETKALVYKLEDSSAEAHLAQLEQVVNDRLSVLTAQLETSGRNRDLIISNTLAEAEKGLEILKAASRQSKLPENFRGVGGAQFLKIDFKEPEDGSQRRARVAELVDQWIDASVLPDGITLVQQAVRKLASSVKARVLHPDLKGSHVDITQMARFSGGESLTSAILLYCSLAQLRARQRGTRRASTVLILDNPIGRSSATNFLELQRTVAQAMRVQLIYTTGVNDYEALRMLPNIIRLRNQRVNSRTGHNIVEIDGCETSLIEAVRISRHETAETNGA